MLLAEQRTGLYRGIVVDSADPEGLQRLRAQVPQLFGTAVTDWAWPAVPIAVGVAVPAQGDNVWITFEAGDPERPVWTGIWRTTRPGGAAPDPNFGGVVAETTFGIAPSNGTAQTLARSDHTHGSPTNPVPAHEAAGDPHPQYTTTAEAAAGVTAHEAAADPHTGYQRESEKGVANGYASLDAGTLVPAAQMATGTPDGTKFLRDDRTWATPAGGGGSADETLIWMGGF